MQHETPTIVANKREHLGSRYAQRLRREGKLPAVIYGHKTDPIPVSVDEKSTLGLIRHGVHVLNVSIDGSTTETCLVRELQFGYLGDNVIHLDLSRVDLDEIVEVSVHLRFVGTPEAARKPGSIVTHDITELPVRCKVRDIPEEIKVDLGSMGMTLLASAISLPAGVSLAVEPNDIVCRVEAVVEEEAAGEAVEAEAEPTTPEVIGEKEKEANEAKEGDKK
ncbi:MAG: 50S ribosomal protein L25 [Phycisphaerales bacterium]|nr:50S ribosomal protein L25 [Phycisphaerales bacterium]